MVFQSLSYWAISFPAQIATRPARVDECNRDVSPTMPETVARTPRTVKSAAVGNRSEMRDTRAGGRLFGCTNFDKLLTAP
jgi:hypothetical protein